MSNNWVQLLGSNEKQAFAGVDPFTGTIGRASAYAKHLSSVFKVFWDRPMVFETQLQLHFQQ